MAYWVDHPEVTKELEERVKRARPSTFDPRDFFKPGVHIHPAIRRRDDVTLLQDNEYIYAVRDNQVITVINVPGSDVVSDFFDKRD